MKRPRILLVHVAGDVRDFYLGLLYFIGALVVATAAAIIPWP